MCVFVEVFWSTDDDPTESATFIPKAGFNSQGTLQRLSCAYRHQDLALYLTFIMHAALAAEPIRSVNRFLIFLDGIKVIDFG